MKVAVFIIAGVVVVLGCIIFYFMNKPKGGY